MNIFALFQSSHFVWSILSVAIMLSSGGILYAFWEKVLGGWGIRH
jgi:hypothetical protein